MLIGVDRRIEVSAIDGEVRDVVTREENAFSAFSAPLGNTKYAVLVSIPKEHVGVGRTDGTHARVLREDLRGRALERIALGLVPWGVSGGATDHQGDCGGGEHVDRASHGELLAGSPIHSPSSVAYM
jgi:hypothetical protein